MSELEIANVVVEFAQAAERALRAGFQVAEMHMAHGYLLHQFLSPISNKREDQFGGSLENRMRFPLQATAAVRKVWPAHLPVFVRISATDWVASSGGADAQFGGGADASWDLQQSIALCKELKKIGVDLIDTSSGGLSPLQKIQVGEHYQVPFAAEIRKQCGILTGAVGMITDSTKAEDIIKEKKADAILLARELLRNPYWTLQIKGSPWPQQYDRAKS